MHAKVKHSGGKGRGVDPLPLDGTYELQVILLLGSLSNLEQFS